MIKSVEMINWRAYDSRRVEFQPGITFLMGANGIGKTSVLEAIAYGLTGEPSTVDRSKLLRDPGRPAEVHLTFEIDGQEYGVERSQSSGRADNAELFLPEGRRVLTKSQKRVTEQIERLMGVSADFLQRIVYMAEGDVFRFLKEPPGKAVDSQIRQVLGLTQLDEFKTAVQAAEKKLKVELKRLQGLFERAEKLAVQSTGEFEQRLEALDAERAVYLSDLSSAQRQIDDLERENDGVIRLAPMLNQTIAALGQMPDGNRLAGELPIDSLAARFGQRLHEAETRVTDLRVAVARLEGEEAANRRVLDILQPYAGHAETMPCPVCHKPMTPDEHEIVVRDLDSAIERLSAQVRQLTAEIEESSREVDAVRRAVVATRELQRALDQAGLRAMPPSATLVDAQRLVDGQEALFHDSYSALERSAAAAREELAAIDKRRAGYLALQREWEDQGFASLEEAGDVLVEYESRSLSLRAVSRAAQETLSQQRNESIEPIYEQLSRVWRSFMGDANWRIELNSDGLPTFTNQRGAQFDLSQFSGGEKTALLVILRTLIARSFARSDFLLIDEPLEHLDPINRRSLVRFLINAYRNKCFGQAIVATFEESLVRKYMSDEGIHVIHL